MTEQDRFSRIKRLKEQIQNDRVDLVRHENYLRNLDDDYVTIEEKINELEKEIKLIENTPFMHEHHRNANDDIEAVFVLNSTFREFFVTRTPVDVKSGIPSTQVTLLPPGADDYQIEILVKNLMLESRKKLISLLKGRLEQIDGLTEEFSSVGVLVV